MTVRLLPLASDRHASELVSAEHRTDKRAPLRHLSPERHDRGIIDAARSTIGHGSACAALIEYSEVSYPENPAGQGCGQN